LAFVAVLTSALPWAASAGEKDRYEPFAAGAQIAEWLVPGSAPGCNSNRASPNTGIGTIQGSGLATSIGAFTVTSTDCVRSASPYGFYPPFNFSSRVLTLTVANGDQIVAAYAGTAEFQPPGLLQLSGSYTFIRGTGQFTGVKGSGTLLGVEDISLIPATGFVTFTGTISR
jgi:hypothetical protein